MAFIPEGVKVNLPPWKSAYLRTTIRVVQLTVEHPVSYEHYSLTLRAMRRYWKSTDEIKGAKQILRMWSREKARVLRLAKRVMK